MKRSKIKCKNRAFIITPQFMNRFEAHLKRRGHTVLTTRSYLSSARHFIYWIKTKLFNDRRISRKTIQFFLNEHLPHCSCPSPVRKEIKTVRAALNQVLLMEGHERIQANIDRSMPEIERTVNSFDEYLLISKQLGGRYPCECEQRCGFGQRGTRPMENRKRDVQYFKKSRLPH